MFWKPVTTVIVGLGSVLAVQAEGEVGAEQKRAIGEVLAGAPISSITVSTSGLSQCGETTVSWTGTTSPVSLMVGTGGYYANLQTLQTIDNLDGSSTQVFIDQKEGTDMIFQITDGNGQVGYVQNQKVGGGDSSCLSGESGGSSGSSSSAAAGSSTSQGEAAPVVVTSSESPDASSTRSGSGSGSTSSAAAPVDESPSAAGSSSVQPTQSPAAAASTSARASSASSAAVSSGSQSASSASNVASSGSAVAASASASASASTSVDASAANLPNSAAGLVTPGLTAVGVGLVMAAIL